MVLWSHLMLSHVFVTLSRNIVLSASYHCLFVPLWRLYGCDGYTVQDTYDMQWSFSGDVLLTTDSARTLQLLDLRYDNYLAAISLQPTKPEEYNA